MKILNLPIKNYYNYVMDFLLLCGFLAITVSSYILWFVLPMGQGLGGIKYCDRPFTGEGLQGNQTLVLNLPRHSWVDIHSWISVVIVALVIIHILLHWRWIVETTKRVKSYVLKRQKAILERYIAAFILFILTAFQVLAGFVLWLIVPRGVGNLSATLTGTGRTFWGLQRNVWVDLHAWVAVFMVAIIVVHLIIHWRWIINMTLGKRQPRKTQGTTEAKGTQQINKPKAAYKPWQPNYLSRAGMLIGLVGATGFLVAMFTFQLDWVGKYSLMLCLIPVPFINLILARKWPLINGALLIIMGIASIVLFLIYPVGVVWNQIGVWNELGPETIYTLAFVTLPLVVSGALFIISDRTKKRRIE